MTSIRTNGVKEPVILRLREDGEYELVAGYRRLRACELAKKTEIPAWVYEMTLPEAKGYHAKANMIPALPVPRKLHESSKEREKAPDTVKERGLKRRREGGAIRKTAALPWAALS